MSDFQLNLHVGHVDNVAVLISRLNHQLRGPATLDRILKELQLTSIRIESRFGLNPSGQTTASRVRRDEDEIFEELLLVRLLGAVEEEEMEKLDSKFHVHILMNV